MSLGVVGKPGASAVEVICDAGVTRTPGCYRRIRLASARGWVEVPDPWGRSSRLRPDGILRLHLCPACAPREWTKVVAADVLEPDTVDEVAVIAMAGAVRTGRERRLGEAP